MRSDSHDKMIPKLVKILKQANQTIGTSCPLFPQHR
jgi:hypothetical protein